MEYTVRLNNVGDFALPPSRVEALYAPEMFGEVAECAGEGGGGEVRGCGCVATEGQIPALPPT